VIRNPKLGTKLELNRKLGMKWYHNSMIDHYSIRIKESYAIGSAINTDSNNEHYVYNYTFFPYNEVLR